MALPINILDLLRKHKVESNRIEFKKGWNPASIYRTICAFANDFDNLGGGYILVGVEEENGIAKRPVTGIPADQLDKIQREMVALNHLIDPYYASRLSVEDVDDTQVLVIWVPSGLNRPYAVPQDVLSKHSKPAYYIRYGTSSVEAKGEQLDELRDMANKVPFDDRGNPAIQLTDISTLLLREYLVQVNSRLMSEDIVGQLPQILEQMNLYDGATERRYLKNVAAMMFCEHPEKFFPFTQVDIVTFPQGRLQNPSNLKEAPAIKGSVPAMIRATLEYLRTNVIKERIIKPKDDARSIRFFNYPYQALEEAVVNALYHRDYTEREPVEITIEPDGISILSFAGPDRSISMEAIHEGRMLQSRRYRNRRLGEFLKELELSEGRATGIPTIQDELRKNGSPAATIQTNTERSFFLVKIPCHPEFVENVLVSKNATANSDNIAEKWPKKWPKKWPNYADIIIDAIRANKNITIPQLEKLLPVGNTTIDKILNAMQSEKYICRVGSSNGGYWQIVAQD